MKQDHQNFGFHRHITDNYAHLETWSRHVFLHCLQKHISYEQFRLGLLSFWTASFMFLFHFGGLVLIAAGAVLHKDEGFMS